MTTDSIASRVKASIQAQPQTPTQASIAESVQMTPDAFSRALKGERNFSTIELARLANLLTADLHWLITGEPDPLAVKFAARHEYNHQTGRRDVPGRNEDEAILQSIELAYRQAHAWRSRSDSTLPSTSSEVREALGYNFVRSFADRVEQSLGVDVLRIQNLSTDYSFAIDGYKVALLRSNANWFRSNWSLAHELGHLALGHHDSPGSTDVDERAANQFAAELLLPESQMRAVNWETIDESAFAGLVWDLGVSNPALKARLESLRLAVSDEVRGWLSLPTQVLLRKHVDRYAVTADAYLPVAERMTESAERRVPLGLVSALAAGIEAKRLGPATLAWLLETDPSDVVEQDLPEEGDLSTDALMELLGVSALTGE